MNSNRPPRPARGRPSGQRPGLTPVRQMPPRAVGPQIIPRGPRPLGSNQKAGSRQDPMEGV